MNLSIVTQDAVEDLKGEVPASALSLDVFQKTDSLDIMEKMPETCRLAKLGKEPFSIVTKRRVTEVMPQGDGLNQVLVESEETADGPRDFGDQLYMKHPVGDMVIFDQVENLCFVNVSGVGKGVKDPIRIQRKILPVAGEDHFLLCLS